MDISTQLNLPVKIIDAIAREILGDVISGVSVGDNTRIHLLDASLENQGIANSILNNFGGLTVSADTTSMTEGDANPAIHCTDGAIASDSDVGYIVLLDGEQFAQGITSVTAGEVNLNLISPVAGTYGITIYRTTDTYVSGSVTINVHEEN
jgi:hypothetical protein